MRYLHRVPEEVIRKAGHLEEFAKDAAIASIRTKEGRVFSPAVIVFPDYIAAIDGFESLPFQVDQIESVFQTSDDLKKRSQSSWKWLISSEP